MTNNSPSSILPSPLPQRGTNSPLSTLHSPLPQRGPNSPLSTINSPLIKPGYKQTEVGVIPEDWEVARLGDLCKKIQDGTHFSPKIRGGDFLYITSKNIGFGVLDVSNAERITIEQHTVIYRRCDVRKNDVLLTKDGANTGNATLNTLDQPFSLLSSVAFLRFDEEKHVPGYFLQQILSDSGQKRIKEAMSGNAITRLTLEKINNLRFVSPSLPEQRAIAQVLSDVDDLISALDKLIVKKRNLKQAAMQQLLTGKTRLPGFSGEWEVKRLGEVAIIDPENLTATTPPDYSFNYISLEDVDAGYLTRYAEETFASSPSRARRKLCAGDVLVSTVRPNLQSHLLFDRHNENWICSTGFSVVRCLEGESYPNFVFFNLFSDTVSQQIHTLLTGSNYPAINSKDVGNLLIPSPSIEEQTAIAAVLSDMDAEIEVLEARRDKTCNLKQAMMQELLTGRVRLVN